MRNTGERAKIGWQGVFGEVPAEWSLGAVNGDAKTGYFRVDSGESLALEVRWSPSPKPVDLEKRVEDYLQGLRKSTRKRGREFRSGTNRRENGEVTFSWEADRKARGLIWRCEPCGRVVLAQLSGDPGSGVSSLSSWILPSLADHTPSGRRTWALYGLVVEIPAGYVLEKHKMLSGYIQLAFVKGANRLTVEQWGLAATVLKKSGFSEWFSERIRYDLRGFRHRSETLDIDGDEGISYTGRRKSLGELKRTLSDLSRFRKPAIHVDGLAWVCPQTNKIYSIQSIHTAKEMVVDDMLDGLVCH